MLQQSFDFLVRSYPKSESQRQLEGDNGKKVSGQSDVRERYESWKKEKFRTEECQRRFALDLLMKDGMGAEILASLDAQETKQTNDTTQEKKVKSHNKWTQT